ncbi:CopD family protein [Variovorax sp. J22R133]|uniref:CopD family protein n=1 Tax=Variovorax brevis TaxID=3053503 RepID=UPI002574921F|nr:CopD family protein [Variovorax sp. J22R133]MDM0114733.1 CopD family protein [Variovorax sp. J22R133]
MPHSLSLLQSLLLCLHALAAALWVGGMATMHFAVRPAAVQTMEPPARLRFMHATLARFFSWVSAAIALLLATGFAMIAMAGGFAAARWNVHAMMSIGIVMMVFFARIRLGHYRHLSDAVTATDWPAAGAALGSIRQLVFVNLWLGVAVFVVALVGRSM